MARIIVSDYPELTKERALELFRNHFSGKYEVQGENGTFNDFVVRKSDWHAVGIRFREGPNGGTFSFSGFTPSLLYRMLPILGVFAGFPGVVAAVTIMFLALTPSRKELEKEISGFLMNANFDSTGRLDPVPEAAPSLR